MYSSAISHIVHSGQVTIICSGPRLLLGERAFSGSLGSTGPVTCCGSKKGKASGPRLLLLLSVLSSMELLKGQGYRLKMWETRVRSQMMTGEAVWFGCYTPLTLFIYIFVTSRETK